MSSRDRGSPSRLIVFVIAISAIAAILSPQSQGSPASDTGSQIGVRASIPLGTSLDAFGPEYDGANGDLYVSEWEGTEIPGDVLLVSGATNSILGAAQVGVEPEIATVDGANGDLYVANFQATGSSPGTVSVISGTTGTVVRTISVWYNPTGVAFDSDDGQLFICNSNSSQPGGSISVVSGSTNTLLKSVPVGQDPSNIEYDAFNGNVYVLDEASNATGTANQVTVISGSNDSVLGEIYLGPGAGPMFVDGQNGEVYVGGTSSVSAISSATNAIVGSFPIHSGEPAFVNSLGDVYVFQPGNPAHVSVISDKADSINSSFSVGDAASIAYDPATNDLFTLAIDSDVVNVTSASSQNLVTSLNLGAGWFLSGAPPVYDPGNGEIYVIQYGPTHNLVVISSNETEQPATAAFGLAPWVYFALGVTLGVAVLGLPFLIKRGTGNERPSLRESPRPDMPGTRAP